jgi:hypothetical protein
LERFAKKYSLPEKNGALFIFALNFGGKSSFKWQVNIAGWNVPMLLSAVPCIIAACVAAK